MDLEKHVVSLVSRYREAGYFPTCSLRIFTEKACIFEHHQGVENAFQLYDVASLTKIATSTQILQLIEQGRLHLKDELPVLFPEIRASDFLNERLRNVTLFRLLTHTSGLPAWYPFYSLELDFYPALEHVLKVCSRTSGVVYSDLNFMLLGKLLERMYDLPLADCLEQNLVRPLGLGSMLYRPSPERSDLVPSDYGNGIEEGMCEERNISFAHFRPHCPVPGNVNDGNSHYYFHDVAGHAGVFADTRSYMLLCQMYMNAKSGIFADAQKTQSTSPGRGLGFQTTVMYPHGCGHLGFTGTSLYFSSERHIGVVAMTNRLCYPHDNPNPVNDFRRVLHELVFASAAD